MREIEDRYREKTNRTKLKTQEKRKKEKEVEKTDLLFKHFRSIQTLNLH